MARLSDYYDQYIISLLNNKLVNYIFHADRHHVVQRLKEVTLPASIKG